MTWPTSMEPVRAATPRIVRFDGAIHEYASRTSGSLLLPSQQQRQTDDDEPEGPQDVEDRHCLSRKAPAALFVRSKEFGRADGYDWKMTWTASRVVWLAVVSAFVRAR